MTTNPDNVRIRGDKETLVYRYDDEKRAFLIKPLHPDISCMASYNLVTQQEEDYFPEGFRVIASAFDCDPVDSPQTEGRFYIAQAGTYSVEYKGKVLLKIEDAKLQRITKINAF